MSENSNFKFIENDIELRRDVQAELAEWKEKRHHKVLQVEGPRQVGKTHEVRKFAYHNYQKVIYVNLVRDEYGFEDCLSEKDLMGTYCRNAGIEEFKDDPDTILIIDEIQEKATVYNAIRDIRERLNCDIIVSGSYLARTVNSKDFFLPAGIAYLRMFPLSFREFCRALSLEDTYVALDLYGGSSPEEYQALEEAYEVYKAIGGYPEVVTTYIRSKSTNDCKDVLADLMRTFTNESARFFSNSTALSIFNEVYRAVFVEMSNEKKGTGSNFIELVTDFVKDSIKQPVSRNEVRQAASWLLYSGIIGYCDLYNNGDVNDVVSDRRAYFADCGIASYISSLVNVPQDAATGFLTETFAYEELSRAYFCPPSRKKIRGDKPCFSICGNYELDFLVVDNDHIRTGVEVKSGDNKARSLEFFREKGLIERALKAIPSHGGRGEKFDTIPIYMIGRVIE